MNATADIDAPFGTYPLSPALRLLKRLGASPAPVGPVARKIGKPRARRLDGPVDVLTDNDLRLRLHPADNNCEHKILFGGAAWNRKERAAVHRHIAKNSAFTFLDVGANVGLYTLDALAFARRHGKTLHAVAIEPDAGNRARLHENLALNAFGATVLPFAVSDAEGFVNLESPPGGRGAITAVPADNGAIRAAPLLTLVRELGLARVDAIKIDVEEFDRRVLGAYFRDPAPGLQPRLVICETGTADADGLSPFLATHAYTLTGRTRSKAIMERT